MGESESESESEEDVRQGLLKPQKRRAVESSGGRTRSAVSDDSEDEQEVRGEETEEGTTDRKGELVRVAVFSDARARRRCVMSLVKGPL